MEQELLAAVFALLNGDTILKTQSGINPANGSARNVAVFNQAPDNTPVPYVRIALTDTLLLDAEPMDYQTQPQAKTISLLVTAFSDYEPEVFGISARLQTLLRHQEITTANYHGSTWLTSVDYYTDNITDPDHLYRVAAVRVRANLEPR